MDIYEKRFIYSFLTLLFVVFLGMGGYWFLSAGGSPDNADAAKVVNENEVIAVQNMYENNKSETQMPQNQGKVLTAVLHTTEGDITIALNSNMTPNTVNNFVTLAKKGFYDNTIFHRVIKGFMIQGGDPKGNGTGGPGYTFQDEPFEGDYTRGTIAMANAGPNTNGSQFFIMHKTYPLPKNYVIFGRVISGIEAVDKIAEALVAENAFGELSKPVSPAAIKSVDISEE